MQIKLFFVFLLLPGCFASVLAQENDDHHREKHDWFTTLVLGHTYLPAGEHSDGTEKALSVPSWGLDFGRKVTDKFWIVWTNEVHLQSYVISNENFNQLKREYPYITTLSAQYLIRPNIAILAGPGVELEKNENFFVFRVGVEADFVFADRWAFVPSLFYETKEGKFGGITISFGVARGF